MSVLPNGYGLVSIRPTGAFGGFKQFLRGEITWPEALARTPYAGIYQRGRANGRTYYYKRKFFTTTNPQTVPQQAHRTKFANGVIHWQSLTMEEKNAYTERAKRIRLSGFNLHQREWLLS